MTHHGGKYRATGRSGKRIRMVGRHHRGRIETTLIHWCAELRIVTGKLATFHHVHRAVMLPTPAAASGQPRLTRRAHREQRSEERQAKRGQQQNGEQSTHETYYLLSLVMSEGI